MGQGREWAYSLEQLYEDQDPRVAADAIAQLIWWLEPAPGPGRHRFELREPSGPDHIDHTLLLSWNMAVLAERDPRLPADLRRVRAGKKLPLPERPKCGAYGLAMVAASCILGRRVVGISCFRPPSLLLASAPGEIRGIEVAGRGGKGYSNLQEDLDGAGGRPGKRGYLKTCPGLAEAYLSVWCREPMVAIWEPLQP
jgi:hypothetical protein